MANTKDNDNDKEQSSRLETIETLLTFLAIENNNLNIHSQPSIKSDRGQHSQFLRCFTIRTTQPFKKCPKMPQSARLSAGGV